MTFSELFRWDHNIDNEFWFDSENPNKTISEDTFAGLVGEYYYSSLETKIREMTPEIDHRRYISMHVENKLRYEHEENLSGICKLPASLARYCLLLEEAEDWLNRQDIDRTPENLLNFIKDEYGFYMKNVGHNTLCEAIEYLQKWRIKYL